MELKTPLNSDSDNTMDIPAPPDFSLDRAVDDISEWDVLAFQSITSTDLSPDQIRHVCTPGESYPRQKEVLAIHWHPEWVPPDIVYRRVEAQFPKRESELIIPTQHNEIVVWGDFAGVEVDCYSSGFDSKVQLLLHFKADRLEEAGVLKSMLDHTFKYRSSQLFAFIESIINPEYDDRMQEAAELTGANEKLVALLRFYTARLNRLLYDHEGLAPPAMIKNKLIPEFLNVQRKRHPDTTINRALLLAAAVKKIVKRNFPLTYFFGTREVIEEARSLGAGIVIPHPEQFWPILLADYDVDGWEVWNPQSQQYTQFLITALNHQNKLRGGKRERLLVFMGDDTHLSVKLRDPKTQEKAKLEREVGLQPAWDDIGIRKSLSLANSSRAKVINDYKDRLN